MARPLRIEFPGALYHVTSRGDRREPIVLDDEDRGALLAVVAKGMDRFDAQMLSYCLMDNHYHFVINTHKANLSLLMQHINGVYTQAFNRRHNKVGHLFQGRFKAILVDRDAYLLEVCRYVELNPVRARMVKQPQQWAWSSYRAHTGEVPAPKWLDSEGLYGYLLSHAPQGEADRRRAAQRYATLVEAGRDERLWDSALRQQIYLGDQQFVERMQALADETYVSARDVPKVQRSKPLTLVQWLEKCETREEAFMRAYTQSGISMTAIAAHAQLSVSYVSRLVARAEQKFKDKH